MNDGRRTMELSVIIYFIFLGKGNDYKMSMDFMTWEARKEDTHSVRLVSGTAGIQAHGFYKRCGYGMGKEQFNF